MCWARGFSFCSREGSPDSSGFSPPCFPWGQEKGETQTLAPRRPFKCIEILSIHEVIWSLRNTGGLCMIPVESEHLCTPGSPFLWGKLRLVLYFFLWLEIASFTLSWMKYFRSDRDTVFWNSFTREVLTHSTPLTSCLQRKKKRPWLSCSYTWFLWHLTQTCNSSVLLPWR